MGLFDASRPLSPAAAYELGVDRGKAAHISKVIGGTLADQPDFRIKDHAMRWFTWPAGMEMGAHDAFRRGFNEGIGRAVFEIRG